MILAAGKGARLAPLSADYPKSLFPVGDRPVVAYLFDLLKQCGIKEVAINLFHRGDLIEDTLGDGSRYFLRLSYSREEKLLGTGGGVRKAREFWGDEDILVINGDNLLELNLQRMVRVHIASEAAATMALRPLGSNFDYTPIYLDRKSNVEAIGGKTRPGPGYAFIGAQILSKKFIDLLPASRPGCLIRDGYQKALQGRRNPLRINGFVSTGYWREISTFSRYWEANDDFLRGRLPSYCYRGRDEFIRRGLHVGKGCGLNARNQFTSPVYLGNGCRIGENCRLGPRLLVGTGATVGDGCWLQNVVVWPKTTVRKGSVLEDVIVTPFGKVKFAGEK
jgi:NDP-sugar pyrophosphorylase family protein